MIGKKNIGRDSAVLVSKLALLFELLNARFTCHFKLSVDIGNVNLFAQNKKSLD